MSAERLWSGAASLVRLRLLARPSALSSDIIDVSDAMSDTSPNLSSVVCEAGEEVDRVSVLIVNGGVAAQICWNDATTSVLA